MSIHRIGLRRPVVLDALTAGYAGAMLKGEPGRAVTYRVSLFSGSGRWASQFRSMANIRGGYGVVVSQL
jgi:hypothetical protein